jgi:pimeloyl-ACP methyl ester carboxylesterase
MQQPPPWFTEAVTTPFESRTVDVQGCPIHYLAWGDESKPGLVLVHGGAAHAHWWSFIAPHLTRDYRVVALDLSGHGDSGRRESYAREIFAEEVMGVARDAEFIGKPIVVGHSLGGMVTILCAALHGEDLAGVVIVDSPVRKPDPETQEATHGTSFRNPKTYPSEEAAVARFRLVPPQPCENDYVLDHIARHSVIETERGWTWKFDRRVFPSSAPRPMAEYLKQVPCRIALVRGEWSVVLLPETARYMYELLERYAPLIEIPQAHHHLFLDQPLAFIAALRTLLADWEHSVPRRRRR